MMKAEAAGLAAQNECGSGAKKARKEEIRLDEGAFTARCHHCHLAGHRRAGGCVCYSAAYTCYDCSDL